ncbi:MAG TPA: NAD-dependent epimerase/dehydratase family protein [Burkholderiaceae bacterium]|nr:NAD-dependent epimerase/dehydratase family protein [Burkholderiaceae bacterium]
MMQRVLITGGAGFLGSHLADELLAHGYRVRVLDNLLPQVHGDDCRRPAYLDSQIELLEGDVRDPEAVRRALDGVDAVYHFAAMVGVGQSMYQVADYTQVNNVGTAVLLQALIERPVQRLIVASSMSLYGEGLYRDRAGRIRAVGERSLEQLREGRWEWTDSDGAPLAPVPTPEDKPPAIASVYALSKYDQERLCLMIGRAYNMPTVALRFFNAYGPRQALSNPYTGVLAIFAARLLNDNPPRIFEDGKQQRDFVSVYDVAQACRLALEVPAAAGEVFNVGSGTAYTVCEIAQRVAAVLGKEHLEPEILGKYRVGDIRHCFADIGKAQRMLGYRPRVTLDQGLEELAAWLAGQQAVDRVAQASAELAARGLTV